MNKTTKTRKRYAYLVTTVFKVNEERFEPINRNTLFLKKSHALADKVSKEKAIATLQMEEFIEISITSKELL